MLKMTARIFYQDVLPSNYAYARSKNALHLGEKVLATIFSLVVHCVFLEIEGIRKARGSSSVGSA